MNETERKKRLEKFKKSFRDTPRPTMSREEMADDYPRLKREYTLLHEEYRRLKSTK